ncbi:hypothetical protein SAMN05216249_102202 [Acetitomaculum ruminis DSM 5522]|uniref:DUF3784 domain-containing protein n=1 Tax=Acetitomaculum ruminis DSM 5522 TaxID=1120918 RepID=A0A1I0VUF1_9FIRM|nr:hypothetical protein [Acetitomaculum ruminis]SFA79942.1 hypothetical protein SAMN05216249_102202 [Acetitomaculum ruminis DSM 5522]
MIFGFIIWTIVSLIFLGIAFVSWKAKEPVGFFTGVEAPEVIDTVKYNHSVAILWLIYGVLLELLGLPLLFLKQNSAGFVFSIIGVVLLCLLLVVAYLKIANKYKK